MGAWAEGLAAQSKRDDEIRKKVRAREERFRKKYFDSDIKEGEILNKSHVNSQEMYFLLLRQILLNQEALLMDTTARYNAGSDTRGLLRRLEKFMLGEKE